MAAVPLGDRNEEEILRLASSLEGQSEHPIARGIVDAAEAVGLVPVSIDDFRALPGQGATGRANGLDLKVVSPGYLREHGLSTESEAVTELIDAGNTVVFLLVDDSLEGALALGDLVREESKAAIRELQRMGTSAMMLTGDAEVVARSVATELQLDDFFAEVLPHQKAAKVREIKQRGLTVAMVGDGVNDAPALSEADVVLVRLDPADVATIVKLARATFRKMLQNLWWATGYNLIAIPMAAGALFTVGFVMPPAVGAALMSASTVIVAINAQLLRRAERRVASPASID